MPFSGNSQQIKVVDAMDLQPLEFATIVVGNSERILLTDQKGEVSLSGSPKGSIATLQYIGYIQQQLLVDTLTNDLNLIYLVPNDEMLQEIVISANRSQQVKHLVTQPVHTQDRSGILKSQPQTSADLLQNSEKVYVQKSQMGGGSPMIRGFSANRLLLVVDGVRMNNAIFRSGNVHNVLSIDPLAITQTDVIFGPGAVNYGSDAIGGVISFSTLQPRFRDKTTVNALTRWSSANNEKTMHVDLRTGSKKFAYVFSLSHSNFSDLQMGKNAPRMYQKPFIVTPSAQGDEVNENPNPLVQAPTGYQQTNFMQKLAFRPNPHWQMEYGLHYAFTNDIPRYDRLILTDENTQPQFAAWYYGPQSWLMNAFNVTYRKNNPLFDHIRLTAAHQINRESRNERRFDSNNLRSRKEKVDALSFNLDFQKRLAKGHFLLYGIEAVHNTVGSVAKVVDINSEAIGPLSTRYPDGSTWASYAGFANYKINWSEKLSTIAGLRYNSIHTRASFDRQFFDFPFDEANLDQRAFNGSLGAVWLANKNLDVSFTAGTGFRAPNIDDIGKVFDSEPGNVVVPNPNLKPEIAYSIEMSINYEKDEINLGFSTFHTWLEQALIRSDYTLNGMSTIIYDGVESHVQALVNASRARVYGLQADGGLDLSGNFSVKAHLTFTRGAAVEEGIRQPLRHVPPLFGSLFINYKKSIADLSLFGRFNERMPSHRMPLEERNNLHIYPLDAGGQPYSPSWYTLNFRSTWQLTPSFTLFAAVENITDQGYWPFAGGIAAPGRNVVLSLRMSL
ncbi:MAG TPA: TonB-dependent receptor [Anditalea sp.]|nr:TonB-dependent receptor [Anditalea sp.]